MRHGKWEMGNEKQLGQKEPTGRKRRRAKIWRAVAEGCLRTDARFPSKSRPDKRKLKDKFPEEAEIDWRSLGPKSRKVPRWLRNGDAWSGISRSFCSLFVLLF